MMDYPLEVGLVVLEQGHQVEGVVERAGNVGPRPSVPPLQWE